MITPEERSPQAGQSMTAPDPRPPVDQTGAPTPTQQWRSHAVGLPPLPPGSGLDVAERLLLLTHYCIDWQAGWVRDYRPRYWDHILPGRLRTATYRSRDLYAWWSAVSSSLGCSPQSTARRNEVVALLAAAPAPALEALRDSLPALLLRVRIITEAVAADRVSARPGTNP